MATKREFYGKLNQVKVIFKNLKYNYRTDVSQQTTKESVTNYFVGKFFDVGSYPNENMQKVEKIIFYKNPLNNSPIKNQSTMATKKPTAKQLAARAAFTKMVKEKAAKKRGLNAAAKPKKRISAKTLCRKVISQAGISKRTGQLLKGWKYQNGKPVKVVKAKKATAKPKKKTTVKKEPKRKKFLGIF